MQHEKCLDLRYGHANDDTGRVASSCRLLTCSCVVSALQVDVAEDSAERCTSVGPLFTVASARDRTFGMC